MGSLDWDDSSSDLECFEAYFLEEEPVEPPPAVEPQENDALEADVVGNVVGLPNNNDDPDDPDPAPEEDNAEESDSSSSEESDNDEVVEVANVTNASLNENVELLQNLTKGQIMILQLANAVRHNMTFENVIDQFKNLNVSFGPHAFPESKTKLWDVILLNKVGIKFHVYCGRNTCGRYIKRKDKILGDIARCRCGYQVHVRKAKYFLTLDLRTQLRYFLSIPGIWQKLQYPNTRQKVSATAIEDVMDGSRYRRMKEPGGPLADPNNFSYFFSSDACKPSKKGSLKLTPFYLRLNELPPELRQKFYFPIAAFCDHNEPNFQAFMKPIVKQLCSLSITGINWTPEVGGHEINSKFFCLGFNVDSPVRYSILNMSKWDSIQYGCTYCTHQGIRVADSQRYPELNLDGIPPFADRSHDGMIAAMLRLEEEPNLDHLQGHRGPSHLMLLPHLDLRDGQAHDDLHQDHEGCAKDITELLLTVRDARVDEEMPYIQLVRAAIRAIDARLLHIKTPSRISRKPRSILKRGSWSGTEWRNWLFFYAIPCLVGLIKARYLDILASLCYGCYLLSLDAIEPEDINRAELLLLRANHSFELIFGVGRLKYNFHLTTKHKVRSVRALGNPSLYSTYNYESLHRRMTDRVTSPKGILMQLVTRLMLHLVVQSSQFDERILENVRLRITEILNPYQLKKIREVAPHIFLIGRGRQRGATPEETAVFQQEGIHGQNIMEYKSCLIGSTRYWSAARQNPDIKSDDTFIYTRQDTYCTVRTICSYVDENQEERYGMFVTEHDVLQIVPVARHLSILQHAGADLLHFIHLDQIRAPAVKVTVGNRVYAASVPNCLEID